MGLIKAPQNDGQPMIDGGDEPKIEADDAPESTVPFNGDLAAFTFNEGQFPQIDKILKEILKTVDAKLLINKQITFNEMTVTNGKLVNKDGSPLKILNNAAQDALSQLVQNLPDKSTVSINFIIDNLTKDDQGKLSVVLGFTITCTSEVPTSHKENPIRTDITYLDGKNKIQIVQGTPVPKGVTTGLTLTTAGKIRSALEARGITLNAKDSETVLVETMTRVNGGTPQEIIIRVIYGDLTGESIEPSVINPTSAKITIPSGINIRTEPNTRSDTRKNTSHFEAATIADIADFPEGTDLSKVVLKGNGTITINDGTYEWIVLRNPNWTPDQETEPQFLYAAFADKAIVDLATGTSMPNLDAQYREPQPVVLSPEAVFGFPAGTPWENLTFRTRNGEVIKINVNPESFMPIGPNKSFLMLGVYDLEDLVNINADPQFIKQLQDYFKLVRWVDQESSFFITGVVLSVDVNRRKIMIATKDKDGKLIVVPVSEGFSHLTGYNPASTASIFGPGSTAAYLRANGDGMSNGNFVIRRGHYVFLIGRRFLFTGGPGAEVLKSTKDQFLRALEKGGVSSDYDGEPLKLIGISAAIVNARTGKIR
jgi:hypothetical protein